MTTTTLSDLIETVTMRLGLKSAVITAVGA
jgi:hypothetical protein